MGALSTWTSWITIVGVSLALYVIVWPRVQHLAIRRAVLYFDHWRSLLNPAPRARWYKHWYKQLWRGLRIVPVEIHFRVIPNNVTLDRLVETVNREVANVKTENFYVPSEECDADDAQVAAYVFYRLKRALDEQLMRRHRGLRCSGGCNTKYGNKRRDHDFVTADGVRRSGGWLCETLEACSEEVTGDHFCGMCLREQAHDEHT